MERFCGYCGEPVRDDDWDEINGRRVYICGEVSCQREFREDERASYEDAQQELHDDWYGR